MGTLSKISGWLKAVAGIGPDAGDDLRDALAWVIEGTGGRVRRLRGDEKRLLPAVRRALGHVEAIVQKTAGPIEVRRKHWDTDPVLNAFFPSVEVLSRGLDGSVRLRRFFRENAAQQAFGLLTMRRTEKITLAAGREGELIQRDVARTAVGFEDHEIGALFPTEAETRRDLVRHGMHYLGGAARDRIAGIEAWIADLETRRHVLEKEIRFAESGHEMSGTPARQDRQLSGKIAEGRAVLAEIDAKIAALGAQVASPKDDAERLVEILEAPEKYLDLRTVFLYLDAMNIKVDPKTAGDARHIALTELVMENGARMVGVIVQVPREEVRGGA
jgi:hypothetical protein